MRRTVRNVSDHHVMQVSWIFTRLASGRDFDGKTATLVLARDKMIYIRAILEEARSAISVHFSCYFTFTLTSLHGFTVLSSIPARIPLHRVGSLVDLSAQILSSYDVALQSHSLGILIMLYIRMSVVTSWWFQQLCRTVYMPNKFNKIWQNLQTCHKCHTALCFCYMELQP